MARAAGLKVYLMRVADRDEYFFQQNVPNPSQLTSEIAIVMVDGKEIFLDPATPFCPYGHVAWQHTSTQGIRQTADGSTALVPTPAANYKDAISKRVGHLTLNEDGSAKGKIGIAWAGEEALVHRLSSLKTDAAGRKKELEDELKSILPAGALVQLDTAAGWEDAEKQLSANFSVEIPSYASSAGKRLLVPTNLFESHTRQPFAQGERKQPVYFNFPYYVMDETQITFPSTFKMEDLAEVQPIRTDYSLYQLNHSAKGNTRKFYGCVSFGDSQSLVLTTAK
jgi:hypothetical protein